jgi:hypothetical protein
MKAWVYFILNQVSSVTVFGRYSISPVRLVDLFLVKPRVCHMYPTSSPFVPDSFRYNIFPNDPEPNFLTSVSV